MMVGCGWVQLAWNEAWRRARAEGWWWPRMPDDGGPPPRWKEFVYSTDRHKRADPASPVVHYAKIFNRAEHEMHLALHAALQARLSGVTSYHLGT